MPLRVALNNQNPTRVSQFTSYEEKHSIWGSNSASGPGCCTSHDNGPNIVYDDDKLDLIDRLHADEHNHRLDR